MYEVVYADPPYRYQFSRSKSRKIENHYRTLAMGEIADLPVSKISAKDAVLFLWSPAPKLEEALEVMWRWGFQYKTGAMWDKEIIGTGYYVRGQHEHLLIGTRGKPGVPLPENRESSVHRERRGKHSAKPQYYRELIERMYPDRRRIELFAREEYPGWVVWGDEVTPGKTLLEVAEDGAKDFTTACSREPVVPTDR